MRRHAEERERRGRRRENARNVERTTARTTSPGIEGMYGERGRRKSPGSGAARWEEEEPRARVYRAKWSRCPECGQVKSATNMARHPRTCRGGGEP